ncbi:MAG: fused MFS/spermidine synthase [Rhizobiales bacterium]|nr:fused MFS/spermidine synthase [Hyphomicrobiales bacterium]
MTTIDVSTPPSDRAGAPAWLVRGLLTGAILVSAFLLFSIQPMFTRMVLPKLGGTPAVWSVAMVFFQTLLLGGYLYAHLSATKLSTRASVLVHLALLAGTTFLLPIAVTTKLGNPPADGEAAWLFAVFALSTGLPFFAVAANGPLLQAWFSRSAATRGLSPYPLYSASNLGSFAALLLYPVLFEPMLDLKSQTVAWSVGFGVLALLIGAAGASVRSAAIERGHSAAVADAAPVTLRQRALWVFFAFVPSGLLVAVTAHISTDVSSGPLLWIIPLSLFLLTFVLIFRDRPLIPHRVFVTAWPLAAALLVFGMTAANLHVGLAVTLHVAAFFVAAMLCHGALYAARPDASHLTEFYLWMSFGGVLGGVFTGLVAPHVFNGIYEYPILIALAFLCLPGALAEPRKLALRAGAPIALAALGALAWPWIEPAMKPFAQKIVMVGVIVVMSAIFLARRTPALAGGLFAGGLAALLVVNTGSDFEHSVRSFFGVNHVVKLEGGKYRAIVHSNTNHGAMRLLNEDGTPATGRPVPVAYYRPGGPYETAISTLRAHQGGRFGRVGITGLGAGGLACHARDGEAWTFFEIDPEVVRIARDPKWFTFLRDCTPDARVILGDARLTLAEEPKPFDMLALDAFSSDAIPTHLMTREAFRLYMSRIAEGGALVVHISNRYMELRSVVAAIAHELGLVGVARIEKTPDAIARDPSNLAIGSEIVVLARRTQDLGALTTTPGWETLTPRAGVAAWTDDYSNTLGALWRKER